MRSSIKAGDVLLIEGRSRVGYIIKVISRSSWSHAAICIGSLNSIKDPKLFARVEASWDGDANEPLLVESEIDRGTVVTPLSHYSNYHMRICRPIGLTKADRDHVIEHMVDRIGTAYSVHQLLDLARFLIPWWTIIPRRWHSTLFEHNAGESTKAVCSSMIAEAFGQVDFPILPLIQEDEQGTFQLFRRNPMLYAPRDFDYSPFFDVIKCPLLRSSGNRWGRPRAGYYRKLVWIDTPEAHTDMGEFVSAHDVLHVRPDDPLPQASKQEVELEAPVIQTPVDEIDEVNADEIPLEKKPADSKSPDLAGD